MPIDIDFEWSVDTKGYRLEGGRIVGNGGPKRQHRLRDFQKLFLIFAKIPKTPEGLLDFVSKFGRLTPDDLRDGKPIIGDNVRKILVDAEIISEALGVFGNRRLGNSPKWPGGPFKYDLPSGGHVSGGIPLKGKLNAWLVPNPVTGAWELQLQPPTLLDAIWLQFGQAITSNAVLRTCDHCGKWFEAGQGTGRRADAKFCSDDCRIEFNSVKRSQSK